METLNNMAAAAAKAVWGDSQAVKTPLSDEPVSGKMGDVSKGEPYDAGNMDPQPVTTEADSALRTPVTETAPATETTAAPVTSTTTTSTTETPEAQQPTTTPASQVADTPTAAPKSAITTSSPEHPEATQFSSNAHGDNTAAQNDVRAPEDAATNPEDPATRAKQDVDNSATGLGESVKPDNVTSPGPRPVAEFAKERGGDAGAVGGGGGHSANGGGLSHEERREGQKEEEEGEGTGEKWVKTTGTRADGGNFDAAVAGAGREAERILEDKGFHHDATGATAGAHDTTGAKAEAHDSPNSADRKSNSSGGSRDKPKLLERIKAKLPHHHHHKKQEV